MKNGPYIMVVAPKNYPGKLYRNKYAYEHHVVIWEKTKKVLKTGEEVHHINGNHKDNRIENLKILLKEQHRKVHAVLAKSKARCLWKCFNCGISFSMQGADFRRRTKGQKEEARILFCGRSCQVKAQQRERKLKKIGENGE